MGFTNTTYASTIDNLVEGSKNRLQNPYYKFTDKKPTIVRYYNQNRSKSTIDSSSELHYAHVSTNSALKFNRINDFILYGIGKIELDYDVGDNGLESNPITGDAIVIPNTIIPSPGDFFIINQIKEPLLFKVNSATPDTLDDNGNFYKIEYQLELTGKDMISQIESQVEKIYNFYIDNVGTGYACLVEQETSELVQSLEELTSQLISYFEAFFFKSKVQTYVYLYNGVYYFYDPFMIEFIRRNNILPNYTMHQTHPGVTFPFEYYKSFFYNIEKRNLDGFNTLATATVIRELNSLFVNRLEEYYEIKYIDNDPYKTRINILPPDLIRGIEDNSTYTDDRSIYNLIINYMNNNEDYINDSIIDDIRKIDYANNQINFYLIPIYIFIINSYIKSLIFDKTIN